MVAHSVHVFRFLLFVLRRDVISRLLRHPYRTEIGVARQARDRGSGPLPRKARNFGEASVALTGRPPRVENSAHLKEPSALPCFVTCRLSRFVTLNSSQSVLCNLLLIVYATTTPPTTVPHIRVPLLPLLQLHSKLRLWIPERLQDKLQSYTLNNTTNRTQLKSE